MSNEKRPVICPWCKSEMELKFFRFPDATDYHYARYECTGCGAMSSRTFGCTQQAAGEQAYRVAMGTKAEKNHVLTLEELQERRETTNDAIPCELRMKNGKSRVAYIAPVVVPLTELYADGWQYKLEEISAEHRTEIYYNGNTVLSHIMPSPLDYGAKWRCWLRYPEKFEREETPWEGEAGDGHNE